MIWRRHKRNQYLFVVRTHSFNGRIKSIIPPSLIVAHYFFFAKGAFVRTAFGFARRGVSRPVLPGER